MRQREAERLRRRFLAAWQSSPPAAGAALLRARFGLRLDGGDVPWCWPTLGALWDSLAALPPAVVRPGPALRRIARVEGDGVGAYRGGATRSPLGPGTVELGVARPGRRTRAYLVPLDRFGATLRHELGHAFAVRLGLYDTLYEAVPHSPWRFEGPREPFLRRLLGDDARLLRLGRRYLAQAPGRRSLRRALEAQRREDLRSGRRPTPAAALSHPALRHLSATSRYGLPCYYQLAAHSDGNIYCYDTGYGRGFIARAAELQRTRASDYGRRSPNEWFAELFSLYFAEGGAPGWPLRRANPELRRVAEFFDERLGEELGVTRSG